MKNVTRRRGMLAILTVLAMGLFSWAAYASVDTSQFAMIRSASAAAVASCAPHAAATVRIRSIGTVELMDVNVGGLVPNTEYELFITQLANAPFGISWYQGDVRTDANGNGFERYIGRFNVESFAVAPGVGPAPAVHTTGTNTDATTNPAFKPIHTYHVGLWFSSPADAQRAGCPTTVTPFNGDHNAGIQVLSTRQFQPAWGPLRSIQ